VHETFLLLSCVIIPPQLEGAASGACGGSGVDLQMSVEGKYASRRRGAFRYRTITDLA